MDKIDHSIRLKIIIVDDNQPDHFFIKSSLSEFKNITFQSFYTGDDFVKYLNKEDKKSISDSSFPDIVILDINMPGLNGFEVFEAAKKCRRYNEIYFTVLTTSITPIDRAKCEEYNLDCNVKPFSVEKFKGLLKAIIQQYHARHEIKPW